MVVIRIKGGLGNQLFQYSVGYSLAKRLNQPLFLDTSFFKTQSLRGYKLGYLNIEQDNDYIRKSLNYVELLKNRYVNKWLRTININKILIGDNSYYLLETKSEVLQDFFSINASNVYLDGYYQSEKYFDKYRNELSKQFVPKYDMTTENIKILNQLKKTNSVAVHVRRGDFLKAKHDLNPRHYLLGENYYIDALKYVNCHIDNPVYYWFSDDIEWVKKQFGEQYNFQYISVKSDNPDIDELMLMKKCNHIIAANSTFSWWAAWLNDNTQALKIVPGRRYGNAEMIPNDWVRI